MTEYAYNRNQIALGPGLELSLELYRDQWRSGADSIPRVDACIDVKGIRRNKKFDETVGTYPDAQMISYLDPNTHKIAEMSGNKTRHLITIFLLRDENDYTLLREKTTLASQWHDGLTRTVPQYWHDPRYEAYSYFRNVPIPSRAYTLQLGRGVEPELAMEKEYLELVSRFLDFTFFIARELD